jgi:hypothetical protein
LWREGSQSFFLETLCPIQGLSLLPQAAVPASRRQADTALAKAG